MIRLDRCIWAVACLAALCAAAAAETGVQVNLTPDVEQPEAIFPYRQAMLEIASVLDAPIAAVRLRASDGGPYLLYPVTVSPQGKASLSVALPASSLTQVYAVEAMNAYDNGRDNASPAVLARGQASVHWGHLSTSETIINPRLFLSLSEDQLAWSVGYRQQMLVLLLGVVIVSGFLLLISHRAARGIAAAALGIGATVLTLWIVRTAGEPVSVTRTMEILHADADSKATLQTLTIVAARRTEDASLSLANLWKPYPDEYAMRDDETVLRPREPEYSGGVSASFRVRPDQLGLFLATNALPPGRPALPAVRGELKGDSSAWILTATGPTPPALLIAGARFARIDAMARNTPREVSLAELTGFGSPRVESILADPAGFGLETDAGKLFGWWDRTWPRGQSLYLVYAQTVDGVPRLCVTEVESEPTAIP